MKKKIQEVIEFVKIFKRVWRTTEQVRLIQKRQVSLLLDADLLSKLYWQQQIFSNKGPRGQA